MDYNLSAVELDMSSAKDKSTGVLASRLPVQDQ